MTGKKLTVCILDPSRYDDWNKFVDLSPQGDVFCYSWWLDVITESNFKLFAVLETGNIVAGFAAAFDSRGKINEPPLTRTLGTLFSSLPQMDDHRRTVLHRKWLNMLLAAIPLNDFVQVSMHHTFTDWLPFRWKGFQQTTRYTYLIDYKHKTASEVYCSLDRSRKRMIERARSAGIRAELTDDTGLVCKFLSMTYERQGLKFRIPYEVIENLDKMIVGKGKRIIMKAVDSNKVHAILYTVYNNRSAYCLLSGGDPSTRNLGGHTLVLWETIKYFSDKVSYINLGGSDIRRIESHLQGFGGKLTPYYLIFNERLLEERASLGFHLNEALFHLKVIGLKVLNKFGIP